MPCSRDCPSLPAPAEAFSKIKKYNNLRAADAALRARKSPEDLGDAADLSSDEALCAEELCKKDCAAGGAPESIVAETYEFIVVLSVFAQSAHGYRHAVFKIAVKLGLRHVVFLEIVEEFLRGGGQSKRGRQTLEIVPCVKDLVL